MRGGEGNCSSIGWSIATGCLGRNMRIGKNEKNNKKNQIKMENVNRNSPKPSRIAWRGWLVRSWKRFPKMRPTEGSEWIDDDDKVLWWSGFIFIDIEQFFHLTDYLIAISLLIFKLLEIFLCLSHCFLHSHEIALVLVLTASLQNHHHLVIYSQMFLGLLRIGFDESLFYSVLYCLVVNDGLEF